MELGIGSYPDGEEFDQCKVAYRGEGSQVKIGDRGGKLLCQFEYTELLAILRAIESQIDVERSKVLYSKEIERIKDRRN